MDYEILAEEVAKPEYDGMSAQQVAEALNEKNIAVKVDVETSSARGYLLGTGEWAAMVIFADTPQADPQMNQIRGAAITARDTMLHTMLMETSKPQFLAAAQQMLGALVMAGIISQGSSDNLLGMADGMISRAEELGIGTVTDQDVLTVRWVDPAAGEGGV